MTIKTLTDVAARNAKAKDKPYKLATGGGLYLEVMPNGSKYWRMKYRFAGREKRLAMGVYPEVSLREAAIKRDDARAALRDGRDPSAEKRVTKQRQRLAHANSFEAVAKEWLKHRTDLVETTRERASAMLKVYVYPWIGSQPVGEVGAQALLEVLRRVESQDKLETTQRLRQICGQIFRYAVATGRAERDPTRDLRGALKTNKNRHFASITDPAKVGELLRAIDSYSGQFTTKCALKLAPLVFTRPGELRRAEWSEIDLKAKQWNIPGPKMKMGQPHVVPLSTQALAVLEELQPLTGQGKYLFPSVRSPREPMSDNTVNAALRRLGYMTEDMTGHGFRTMASTLLHELGWNTDAIERQLAHAERDPIKAAYNRAQHLPDRRRMMQAWADYLDGLRIGTNVVPLRQAG